MNPDAHSTELAGAFRICKSGDRSHDDDKENTSEVTGWLSCERELNYAAK